MSGRGDNNKAGTSGQGSSNQSGQGFGEASKGRKSNHGEQTGGKPSKPEPKQADQSSNRNTSVKNRRND